MKKIITLFIFATLFSCEENSTIIENQNNLLIGNWSHVSYNNDTTTFVRVNNLPAENYGISFSQNKIFTERTSGWCGTPPLTFFNIDGTFELEDTLIKISKNDYPNSFAWRIVSLTETALVVQRELTEQEKEHQKLMVSFNEISTIAYSVSCTNSSNWNFTAYGAKACGGPQGYIAYSNEIDVTAFLEKIAIYTQAEKEYNFKYGVVSDCSVPIEPKSVTCSNGYPILNY